ncbi:MAG: 1-(5-phosphoribosyl)-5-[(5-phosphoribosylamino)methylideneamino] imidazole-4-carboxamide isomerase [Chloroflexota bacterium]|nr:1-(5-phosphoribosyl)-5-[(5-phosphoribosylamino)methylideneamino] imidazole-4-carboxamide isomerase [Chloroflexota bacterium]
MILYPAIDIRGGKVVRLREGDPSQQTIFADDPVDAARRWIDAGADWLHVVNLDGAFGEANVTLGILERIAALGIPVQFGGGLRDAAAIARAIGAGAARVVIGTLAVSQPDALRDAVMCYGGEAICAALDARDGLVVTHGWQQPSPLTPAGLGRALAGYGVGYALFTDVSRDGLMHGANIEATEDLARETGLQVIASGGVSSLDEIARLTSGGIVQGAVIGMALYRGDIRLQEALLAAQTAHKG